MGGGQDRAGLSPARESRPFIVLAGPTASGKSALALAIARELDGVVVDADSMQVYAELAILSARPGPAALAAAPHRLYGVLFAAERCSAGRWREMALAAIAAEPGRLPIVVGGTGLYLRALVRGLASPLSRRRSWPRARRGLPPSALRACMRSSTWKRRRGWPQQMA
jgi:tRNA A37 N6-isopentenylltransferase MiaA